LKLPAISRSPSGRERQLAGDQPKYTVRPKTRALFAIVQKGRLESILQKHGGSPQAHIDQARQVALAYGRYGFLL
jgi:hypothetical protein